MQNSDTVGQEQCSLPAAWPGGIIFQPLWSLLFPSIATQELYTHKNRHSAGVGVGVSSTQAGPSPSPP